MTIRNSRLVPAAILILVASVLLLVSVAMKGGPMDADQPVAAANADPQKWIVYGADAEALKRSAPRPSGPRPPLREVANGPGGKAVAQLLQKATPAASSTLALVDYPSVRAASASAETPAGDLFTLTVQRMSRPVSLESLTLRPGPDGLSDLPSGSQFVTVNVTVGDAPADSSARFERLKPSSYASREYR